MPSKEPEAPTTETDIPIEQATEEAYTPVDNNITAENPEETQDRTSDIYNKIIREGEEDRTIEPPSTTPQINLTTTPDETAPYTELNQTPPDITQYTGGLTAPKIQKDLIFEQLNQHAATVGGTPIYNQTDNTSLNEIYRTTMDKREIDTEHLDRTEITLQDTINYIIKLNEENPTEIYALKVAEEMYKDGTITELDKETLRTLNAYLDVLTEAELLEEEGFNKIYDDGTTEIMEHTYSLKPKEHNILESAYKEALKSGIDDMPTSQANELFIDFIKNKTDEIRRNTQIAYI